MKNGRSALNKNGLKEYEENIIDEKTKPEQIAIIGNQYFKLKNVTPNWDARAETNILCHNLTSDIDQPYGFDIAQTQMTEMETAPSLKNKWYGQKAKRLTCSTILEKTMKSSHNSTKIKR